MGLFSCVFFLGGRARGLATVTRNTEKGWVTPKRDFFNTKTSACDGQPLFMHLHFQNERISRINLAAKPLSLEHTNCHSFPIAKRWGVVQFDGVPFEHKEDGKLTARLQVYGRVICPDAAVLVTAFSFRNRKQGSHLTTTDVVFSWQVFLNLQFNNFSSPNITDEEGQSPTPVSRFCHLWHSEISGKAEKKVQLLTLLLL